MARVLVSLVPLVALVAGCGSDSWATVQGLAGDGAIDCGFVEAGGDRTAALDCAEAAETDGDAFAVGWEQSGRDSIVRYFRSRNAAGEGWILGQDTFGGDRELVGTRCTSAFRRHTESPPIGDQFDCSSEGPPVTF
jgi:hypothetical protein